MINNKFCLKDFAHSGLRKFRTDDIQPVIVSNLVALHAQLKIIQIAVKAKKPGYCISITSGYRPQWYNEELRKGSDGVAKKSKHTLGMAADIYMGVDPTCGVEYAEGEPDERARELYQIVLDLMLHREITRGGIGCYSSFVHYDIRGRLVEFRPPVTKG